MATKLTLRMDEELIEKAKRTAREQGKSVSRMVADYFELLQPTSDEERELEHLPPVTRSLYGIAAGDDLDEEDYRRHLEEKHR